MSSRNPVYCLISQDILIYCEWSFNRIYRKIFQILSLPKTNVLNILLFISLHKPNVPINKVAYCCGFRNGIGHLGTDICSEIQVPKMNKLDYATYQTSIFWNRSQDSAGMNQPRTEYPHNKKSIIIYKQHNI